MKDYIKVVAAIVTMSLYAIGAGFVSGITSYSGLDNTLSDYSVLQPILAAFYSMSALFDFGFRALSLLGSLLVALFPVLLVATAYILILKYNPKAKLEKGLLDYALSFSEDIADSPVEVVKPKFPYIPIKRIAIVSCIAFFAVVVLTPLPYFGGTLAGRYYVDSIIEDSAQRCDEENSLILCNTIYLKGLSFKGRVVYDISGSRIYLVNNRFYNIAKGGDICIVGKKTGAISGSTESTEPNLCAQLAEHRHGTGKKGSVAH